MMRLVAIDFETANSMPESACSIGVSVFEDGIEIDHWTTLIRPKEEYSHFEYWNIKIHHIHPEDVVNAPNFIVVYEWLSKYFDNSIFVAHNAAFDMKVFKRCAEIYGLAIPKLKYFCTVELARKMFPFLAHHRLNDCAEYLQIHLDHHNAISDAEACAMIVLNCMMIKEEFDLERFIKIANVTLKVLR